MPLQIIRLSGSMASVDLPGRRAGLLRTAVSSCRPQLVAALVALAQEEVDGRGVGVHLLPDEPGDSDEGSNEEEDGSGGKHRSPATGASVAAAEQKGSAGKDVASYLQGLSESGQGLLHHMAAAEVLLGRAVSVRVSNVVPQAEVVHLSLVGGHWWGGLLLPLPCVQQLLLLGGLCRHVAFLPALHQSREHPDAGLDDPVQGLAGSAGA
jgi:hypothetical protein